MKVTNNDSKALVIRVNDDKVSLMPGDGINYEMDITNGILIGKNYNYMGLIIEIGEERKVQYVSDKPIVALSSNDGLISVYEENREEPWLFRRDGSLVTSNECEFIINGEVRKKSVEDIIINIEDNHLDSSILYKGETLDLKNGCVFGDDIYGFIINSNIPGNENKTVYPTHAPIYGLEQRNGTIRVYERDKSIPWLFTNQGFLLEEADYNKSLVNEQKSYCERHAISMDKLMEELGIERDIKQVKLK